MYSGIIGQAAYPYTLDLTPEGEGGEVKVSGVRKLPAMPKMCEGCGLKQPSYGLPAERRKRWCAGLRGGGWE